MVLNINISLINRILPAVLLSTITAVLLSLHISKIKALDTLMPQDEQLEEIEAGTPERAETAPFSYYEGIIGKRDVFRTANAPEKSNKSLTVQPAPSELLQNYSLIGVVADENPQAIIEDKNSKQTYFLNKGQSLGQMKIEDIQEGKVILEANGQRLELSI